MLFGFFTLTQKTFNLNNCTNEDVPQLCCRRSNKYPHLTVERLQVWPGLQPFDKSERTPLFIAAHKDGKTLTRSELDGKFQLIFYPDPKNPPLKNNIVEDYWANVLPMVICRDIGGYYLGVCGDENTAFFETCNKSGLQCYIKIFKPDQDLNKYSRYGSFTDSDFGEEICIRNVYA